MIGIAAFGLLAFCIFYGVFLYNRLVALKNNRENAFADIDVHLKQRYDLIPQILDAVKGYMKHEEKVLIKVTEARTKALAANTVDDKISADVEFTAAIKGLNIAVEAYPDLKANQNFMHLQTEISDIENKLAAVRRFFNSATKELNVAIQTFPSNIVAGLFGYKEAQMFDLGEEKREELDKAPEIKV